MTDSIFETVESTTPPVEKPAKLEIVLPDVVKDLVGEGKKYASVELALAALPPSQDFIQKLQAENAELRTKVATAASTEEVLRAIREQQPASAPATPAAPAVDEAQIRELLRRELTAQEQARVAQSNQKAVTALLAEKYGEKAQETYDKRAAELGMSVEALNTLVRSTPSAALELLGLKPATATLPGKTKSSVNTEGFVQHRPPTERPRVMNGGTRAERIAAWNAAKPTDS